jgi:hypothetical protein
MQYGSLWRLTSNVVKTSEPIARICERNPSNADQISFSLDRSDISGFGRGVNSCQKVEVKRKKAAEKSELGGKFYSRCRGV